MENINHEKGSEKPSKQDNSASCHKLAWLNGLTEGLTKRLSLKLCL